MPQIGWFEILLIAFISIIVIGPKDFPFVLKKIGSWIGSIKKYVSNIQKEVSDITDDTIDIKPEETKTENLEVTKTENKDNEKK